MATTQTAHPPPPLTTSSGSSGICTGSSSRRALKASKMYLHSSEKALEDVLELELKFVRQTEQQWLKGEYDWLKSLIEAQTGFTRELAHTYTDAVRSLLDHVPVD